MKIPAGTTTTISSVCPRCGTIGKSGKSSCCGRGGSWFRNCGSVGNTKLRHTWYEGIQACIARTRSKTVIARQKGIGSSHGDDMANNKVVIATTIKTFAVTSVNTSTPKSDSTSIITSAYTPDNAPITTPFHTLMANISTNVLMTSSTHTSASTSIVTQGWELLLKIVIYINLWFIMVFLV